MKRREIITIFGCATLLALMPLVPAWADLNMQPGLWESATMVGGETRSTERKCYMRKDIDALEKFQQGQSPPGAPCTASGYKALGNTMNYTVTCEMNGTKTVSAVTATYGGTVIHGSIASLDGTVSATFVNSRIGGCSESSFGNSQRVTRHGATPSSRSAPIRHAARGPPHGFG